MAKKDKKQPKDDRLRIDKVTDLYGPWGPQQTKDERQYWATLNHLADFITEYYGTRCQESSGGCANCQAWAVYDLARAIFMDPE